MRNCFHSRNAYFIRRLPPAMSAHRGIAEPPSMESLTCHNICHYLVSDFGRAGVKPAQRCSKRVLLTREGKKRTKSITHISNRKFSQFLFLPCYPNFQREHNPFLSQALQPQAKCFCQLLLSN